MDKTARQHAILRLVKRRPMRNQAQLVRELHSAGFEATQASVSRDVRELGVLKVNGRYVASDRLAPQARPGRRDPADELITAVNPIGANLIVVRVEVGAASRVAVELDRRRDPDIAGTIAGDDTIFLAVRSRAAQGRVIERLPRPRAARGA